MGRRTPAALKLACCVSRLAPPLLAQRARLLLYPQSRAYEDNFEHACTSVTGSKFLAPTDDFDGYPFAVHGYYDWRNWAIADAVCKPGDTIIEVGANIGTESIGFRDIVGSGGKVVAIEPFPANCDRLRDMVALNGWSNVTVLQMALGDVNGELAFTVPRDHHASGVGFLTSQAWQDAPGTISVRCQTLDALGTQTGAAAAIFIDCEGAETRIIKGGMRYISAHRPAIVLEASPRHLCRSGSSLDELFSILSHAEYCVWQIGRFGLHRLKNPKPHATHNWLCLPRENAHWWRKCGTRLLYYGLTPPAAPWFPFSRREP